MAYTPIVILICNIIIYLLISLIFLTVGFITGIHKKIGTIVIASILILVSYIIIGDIITVIDNGVSASIVNVGIVNGDDPLIMYIGSFVAGITGGQWYEAGKRAGKMIKYKLFHV